MYPHLTKFHEVTIEKREVTYLRVSTVCPKRQGSAAEVRHAVFALFPLCQLSSGRKHLFIPHAFSPTNHAIFLLTVSQLAAPRMQFQSFPRTTLHKSNLPSPDVLFSFVLKFSTNCIYWHAKQCLEVTSVRVTIRAAVVTTWQDTL